MEGSPTGGMGAGIWGTTEGEEEGGLDGEVLGRRSEAAKQGAKPRVEGLGG